MRLYVNMIVIVLVLHSLFIYSIPSEPLLGLVPIKDTLNNPNEINVLTYNIQALRVPFAKDAPGILERARIIPRFVQDFDVVVFAEAFDPEARRLLLKGLKKVGFAYCTCILGSGLYYAKDKLPGKAYNQPYIIDLKNENVLIGEHLLPLPFARIPAAVTADRGTRDEWEPVHVARHILEAAKVGAAVTDFIVDLFTHDPDGEKKIVEALNELDQVMHDGGVLMVSKYPIIKAREFIYSLPPLGDIDTSPLLKGDVKKFFQNVVDLNWDYFANKGVLGVELVKDGRHYVIFGTHTQALYSSYHEAMKNKLRAHAKQQMVEMGAFMRSWKIEKNCPIIMAGDFNTNEFKADQQDLFENMIQQLHAVVPEFEGQQYVSGNDIDVRTSTEPSRIDYVLGCADYASLVDSCNHYVFMRTVIPWGVIMDDNGKPKPRCSLSDHEAMYGWFAWAPTV